MEQKGFKRKTIAFITEANEQIGLGHLYRCMALADEFIKKDINVIFYCNGIIGEKIILENLKNIRVVQLSALFKKLSNCSLVILDLYKNSWKEYIDIVNNIQAPTVSIIDHVFKDYGLETDYIFQIGFQTHKYKKEIKKLERDKKIRIYTGNSLFIFRDEFKNKKIFNVKKQVSKVLVSMGGSDPYQLTEMVADSLELIMSPLTVNYILGAGFNYQRLKELRLKHLKSIHQIKYHQNINNVAEIMMKNDIAVINGGNTRFELALLGIPFLALSFNEEQNQIARSLQNEGIGISMGFYDDLVSKNISEYIINFINDYETRKSMSKSMKRKISNNNKIIDLLSNEVLFSKDL